MGLKEKFIKTCSKCQVEKLETEFHFKYKDRGILKSECKSCWSSRDSNYYNGNKDKKKTYNKENADHIKEVKRVYRENNPGFRGDRKKRRATQNRYTAERYKNDMGFKLSVALRRRLWCAIKGNARSGSAVNDLGCSIEELKTYLENKFYPNPRTGEVMTWDNWSLKGWHIDHIRPLADFDLTNREDFLKACHYTNLQPLWAKENLKKSNKILIVPRTGFEPAPFKSEL